MVTDAATVDDRKNAQRFSGGGEPTQPRPVPLDSHGTMTFGRSPHDPFAAPHLGPAGPGAADVGRLDAPYRHDAADGFGGRPSDGARIEPSGPTPASGQPVQRQPAAAGPALPGILGSLPDHGAATRDAYVELVMSRAVIQRAKNQLLRGEVTAAAAAATVHGRLERVAGALEELRVHHDELHPGGVAGQLTRFARGVRGEATRDPNLADALEALDAIAADTLAIVEAHQDDPALAPVAAALEGVMVQAAPLGWRRPASSAEASERKYAHEACPPGDASPRACTLDPVTRLATIGTIVDRLNTINRKFFEACRAEADAFRKAMEADQKLANFVAGLVVDLLVGALTGPVGAGLSNGLRSGVAAAPASDLSKFATDSGKGLLRAAMTRGPDAFGVSTAVGDARQNTMDALKAMEQAIENQLEQLKDSLDGLDDAQLTALASRLQRPDVAQPDAVVADFAQRYRQQVAPTGLERPDSRRLPPPMLGPWQPLAGTGPTPMRATAQAVRVRLPDGATRMALVEDLRARDPDLAHAVRRGMVGLERAFQSGDDHPLLGASVRAQQDARIERPKIDRYFLRWIDADMEALVGAEVPVVSADEVEGLPAQARGRAGDQDGAR